MHLIIDYPSNQDNVRLLIEVGEQDLISMIESDDKNTLKNGDESLDDDDEELL